MHILFGLRRLRIYVLGRFPLDHWMVQGHLELFRRMLWPYFLIERLFGGDHIFGWDVIALPGSPEYLGTAFIVRSLLICTVFWWLVLVLVDVVFRKLGAAFWRRLVRGR